MNVPAAIKYLKENYEDVDPNYLHAPLLEKVFRWTPGEILKYVMAPELEDGPEERSPEEWQELVEEENDPVEAAKFIIAWIQSRANGQQNSRAMKEYLASPPGQGQYESPTNWA